jgi:hypothetical protein
MMPLLLLVAGCQTPVAITASCPNFPWPPTAVIDHMQGQKETATGYWFKDVIKHGVECDELNQ